MTDSAQDYTYEVLAVDSGGEAMVQMTSFDSLHHTFWYQLVSGDSDGTIASLVKNTETTAVMKWRTQRESIPTVTIGSPISTRYKVRSEGEKPLINFLTKTVEQADSENSDEIITNYTTRGLSDSEKATIYTGLSVTREELWQKLRNGSFIDTVLSGLDIRQPIHASWDATAAGSYNWSANKIASLNVDSVSRVSEGRFKVHFTNPMDDSNYSVFCATGSTDYSGFNASPRALSVVDRAPSYVEVICERTDDAGNEDNFFNSVAVSANKDVEEDSDYIELYNRSSFNFRDGVVQSIKGLIGKNDSDFADFLVND